MSKSYSLSVVLFFSGFLFLLSSCKEKKEVKLPPQDIPVYSAVQKDVPVYETFVGQVYGLKDIPVRARVSGFLEGMFFKEGSRVKKGQLLYTIDPQPYQAKVAVAESQLAEAKTSLVKAKNDLDRIVPLAKINAVSKSDLDAARAEYEAAKAFVEASRSSLELAKIELGYCQIRSQTDGIIGKTNAKVGEFVGQNPNPVILNTVSLLDSVLVEFYLTEADFLRYSRKFIENQQANKQIKNRKSEGYVRLILADGSVFKYKGKVKFIDRNIDPSTGTLLVQTVFPNPDRLLRPGLYAKVRIQMTMLDNAVVIPQRCIKELQGLYSVFVVSDSNSVQKVEVEPGYKTGNMQVIKKGLKPGDKVVIDAIQKVRSGMKINPVAAKFEPLYQNIEN
jgi:membrane fusion protein (multidrug efflux system)